MNVALIPCGFLLVTTGCALLLTLTRQRTGAPAGRLHGAASWRREAQLFVLAAPLFSLLLTLLVGAITRPSCATPFCRVMDAPSRASLTNIALVAPGMLALVVAVGALVIGVIRLVVLCWVMQRQTVPAPATYQGALQRLALRLNVPAPRLRLRYAAQPFAITYGAVRPTIILSTWMLRRLDQQELEAALAHELGHILRHDFLFVWMATTLRDAFFYLPTSQEAYRRIRRDNEVACDDLALAVTRRPLDLASALAKVWRASTTAAVSSAPITASLTVGAQPFAALRASHSASDNATQAARAADAALIEGRITRLMNLPPFLADRPIPRPHALATSFGAIIGWLCLGSIVMVMALALMGCAPGVFTSPTLSLVSFLR